MSKRFTDTEKWGDPWFLNLTPKIRTLWIYICDRCDSVGIWKAHLPSLNFHTTDIYTKEDFNELGSRIKWIDEEKVWITGFIKFQYGNLNNKNFAHQGIIKKILKELGDLPKDKVNLSIINNLIDPLPTLYRESIDTKEKEEEKEKVKEEEEEKKEEEPCQLLEIGLAVKKFGRYNGSEAYKYLDRKSLDLIKELGGWAAVCDLSPKDLRWALYKNEK